MAAANAGLAKIQAESKVTAPAEAVEVAPDVTAAPAGEAKPKLVEKQVAPKPAPVDITPEPKADEPDPATVKGLAAIDKQAARFRAEQARAKADFDLERAELARQRAEVTAKSSSFEELQKLFRADPAAALAKLGLDKEADYEFVARAAFPHTKDGKKDPRSAPIAAQTAKERALESELAELREQTRALHDEFKNRDARADSEAFVNRYLDEAVKAIPAAPSLIGTLHKRSPEKARHALLELGARIEKRDGETPSHAEVVAEYERTRRAELEDQGVDVDVLLKPAGPTAPVKAQSRTLDITAPGSTPAINGQPTRSDRVAAFNAEQRRRTTAS